MSSKQEKNKGYWKGRKHSEKNKPSNPPGVGISSTKSGVAGAIIGGLLSGGAGAAFLGVTGLLFGDDKKTRNERKGYKRGYKK